MRLDSPPALRRRRLATVDPMDLESAKWILPVHFDAKLAAAKQKLGREILVFETSTASPTPTDVSNSEETDDFYEFTAEDLYRISATKKEDKFLKTRKIREMEEAARRSNVTQVVIRVRFPDNYTLEATFHPSEKIESLIDLLLKVVAHPELPFYIYTTPPKKQIKDMSQDFYSAGFIPGAIVYFSYDLPKDDDSGAVSGPYLQEEVLSLKGLKLIPEQMEPVQPAPKPVVGRPSPAGQERKPADKKPIKPKWLKM